MTMNPLPPQAYTKDILLKAYQWLMGQNSSIKEMATTPDILVSLYLKATRDGDHALDRPSIQNFKNELRSLAGMMGELDRSPQVHQQAHQAVHRPVQPQPQQQVLTPQMTQAQTHVAAPAPVVQNVEAPMPAAVSMPAPPMHATPIMSAMPTSMTSSMPLPSSTVTRPTVTMAMPVASTQTHVSYTEKTMTAMTRPSEPLEALDCATKLMIQEVKEEFNLSSDLESLRMLVKIGYSRSRTMLS